MDNKIDTRKELIGNNSYVKAKTSNYEYTSTNSRIIEGN